jgi:hypothetical protein
MAALNRYFPYPQAAINTDPQTKRDHADKGEQRKMIMTERPAKFSILHHVPVPPS